MSMCQFSLFSALRLLQRWFFSGFVLGVCSHEPLVFLSVFCSALPTFSSFCQAVSWVSAHEPLSFLSVLCFLRLLQLCFFHSMSWVSALMSLYQFSLFSALLPTAGSHQAVPGCLS
jgi:hypothetical protein